MALSAVDLNPRIERAPPADLDHVAEGHRAGRLANEARVGDVPVLLDPIEQRRGAERRRSLLIAGDDQAKGSGQSLRQMACRGGDEGGDATLHVGCAPPDKPAVTDVRREGVPPLARRHDVGMPGEGEVRRPAADRREQVLDRAVGSRAEGQAVDGEADPLEARRQHVLRPRVGRGDAGAGDEALGEVKRIDHGFA